jgi:hypothetical protein
MLGFTMFEADSPQAANATLAKVVKSADIRLWEGFPVMLANSLDKQWFNYGQTERLLGTSKWMSVLDSLIAMSLALYEVLNVRSPQIDAFRGQFNPEKRQDYAYISDKLKNKEDFALSGQTMSSERVRTAFTRYSGDKETRLTDLLSEQTLYDLQHALSQIFSSRQKELILKKLRGEPLTKTEREYYSRVIKKKIQALANPELHRLSQRLLS